MHPNMSESKHSIANNSNSAREIVPVVVNVNTLNKPQVNRLIFFLLIINGNSLSPPL